MSRGRTGGRALGLALVALAAGCGEPEPKLPNVIVVSLDTVRPDHLSLYGYERETTPFLEELAAESVVYTRAYATASWTLTSHMSLLTGLYPSEHGVDTDLALSEEVPLLAQRLSGAGYHNAAVYYEGWIAPRFGFDRGFDVFLRRQSAEQAGPALDRVLDGRPADEPLFLFLHLFDAHCGNLRRPGSTMYEPPEGYADLFREGAAERIRGEPVQAMYRGEVPVSEEQAADLVALYDASLRYLDDRLRAWVERWRAEGLLDDALLVVTSDHGEALGQRGEWEGHGGFFEHGLRVPLLVRYPGGRGAGTRDDRLASSVDLVPTVLEELGLEPEPWLPGRSLRGEPRAEGEVVLAERDAQRVAMDGRFKLSTTGGKLEILHDLADDPAERRRLGPSEGTDARQRLYTALERLDALAEGTPGAPTPLQRADAEVRARLEALGYKE